MVAVAAWSLRDLEDLLAKASTRLPSFAEGALLKRAAVLHADIAALHRNTDGYSLPSDGRYLIVVNDGNRVGTRGGTIHWRFGRHILDRLPPDDDIRLWYRATCSFLQAWNEYSELEPHLERGRLLFPHDVVLLLYEGALHEAYAQPRIQKVFEAPAPGGRWKMQPIGSAGEELKEAQRRFERALEIDPALTEARIRLAHVLGARGRHKEAAAGLRGAVERDLVAPMQYYAWLLLGREEQTLGQREAARRAFARALALYPGAQSPRLGLSQLARDEGDRAAALASLEPFRERPSKVEDPWWSYAERHSPDVDQLFAEMYRRLAP